MGNGICSRKQKKIFQFLLLLTVTFGFIYGTMFSYEMHKQLKRTEAMAVKYQQHQESLSAQLQVVYEHRSRLEKSLQKERLEHKKAKEDHLVYKLEAQQNLNKEKQDSSSRFNSLHVQHQMLKNQHEDLKKQLFGLQDEHQSLKGEHVKALDEHRQKYDQLQQASQLEISKLKESVYNLQEENRQLRKAHQDVHIQLQDVRLQVEEYKQLKETLNKMPSLRQTDQNRPSPPPRIAAVRADDAQKRPAHVEVQPQVVGVQGRHPPVGGDPKLQVAVPQNAAQPIIRAVQRAGPERGGEKGGAQEEEQRRELAEEEMEQVGQPQRLEESEQPQEEGEEAEQNQPDENALDRDQRQGAQPPAQGPQPGARQAEPAKSPYEQQREQQRLAAQLAEERRQLQLRQEALQKQRWQAQRERELLVRAQREKEMEQHREANRKEQLLREQQLRQRLHYENMDAGIVQGKADWKQDAEMRKLKEGEEKLQEVGRERHPEGNLAERELNPEDDPNNQGEDEFEEAQRGEAGLPAGNVDRQAQGSPKRPAVVDRDERGGRGALEIAGNPDQQEDALDEQYQEEGEEEAQDDMLGGQKREEEAEEDAYNEDNRAHANMKPHEGVQKERDVRNVGAANEEEENYEEEDEEEVVEDEEEGAHDKPSNRRAEM